MTFLLLTIADKKYAFPAPEIVEVLPNLIDLKEDYTYKIDYLAGPVNYRGVSVPIVDLCMLHSSTPCRTLLSSRIILTYLSSDREKEGRLIGLLGEGITETVKIPLNITKNSNVMSSYYNHFPKDFEVSGNKIFVFNRKELLPEDLENTIVEHLVL